MVVVPGETDLAAILASLKAIRRPGSFTFVSVADPIDVSDHAVESMIRENEGITLVLSHDAAEARGLEVGYDLAWLTLDVHTSLEAVGVTALVAETLSNRGIPCNVIAGYYHDHVLVPTDRADEAADAIDGLASAGE